MREREMEKERLILQHFRLQRKNITIKLLIHKHFYFVFTSEIMQFMLLGSMHLRATWRQAISLSSGAQCFSRFYNPGRLESIIRGKFLISNNTEAVCIYRPRDVQTFFPDFTARIMRFTFLASATTLPAASPGSSERYFSGGSICILEYSRFSLPRAALKQIRPNKCFVEE